MPANDMPANEASPAVVVVSLVSGDTKPASQPTSTASPENTKATDRSSVRRQFLACVAVQCLHLMNGVGMAHSSSLIPALEAADSEIPITRWQSAWLASTYVLAVPMGALLSITLNNLLGRLAIVRLMVLPYWAGCVLIATATVFEHVVAGRLLIGVAVGLAHGPSLLFVAEVANQYIRGGLGAAATALGSMGILVTYMLGAWLPWRLHAWANCALPAVPLLLQLVFAAESPVWLRARGRDEAAAASSTFYYNDASKVLSGPSQAAQRGEGGCWRPVRLLFATAAGVKPLVLLTTIFIIQQLVGVYITIYYAVTFFTETGSTIDANLATILIGVVRLVGCTGVSLIMPRFGRRPLMLASSVGQAVSMAVSGYATMRILDEPNSVSSLWVVGAVLAFIAFCCLGWQTIPWSMMAELFPHEVRSLAQPLNSASAHLLIFVMLQLYPTLSGLVGGVVGIQFLFAATSALAAVFVVVFLPETRNRTLQDIEDYFENNIVFLTAKRRSRAQAGLAAGKPD